MSIDPNIALSVKPIQIANPLEQYMQAQQIQQAQNQSRLADLMYSNQQRDTDQTLKLNDLYKNAVADDGTIDRTKLYAGVASGGLGSRLPAIQKSFMDVDKTQADLNQANAMTQKVKTETTGMSDDQREKKRQRAITDIAGFKTPQEAMASLDAHQQAGDLTPDAATAVRATIPPNPADFPKWQIGMLQRIMSAGDAIKQLSPDANTVAKNATDLKVAAGHDAASRANNQDNIKKDFTINGMNADGSPNLGNQASMVDMLGNYQLNPTVALQRLPAGARSNLIAQVQQKYPGWDETQYDAKKGAAAKFAYGDQGNQMRSFATAGAHLDQLGDLVDQLGNTGSPAYNAAKNKLSTWFGGTAPTNLDAAKDIISQEVTKAIVANGGGEGERAALSKKLNDSRTTGQLKGVISQYRGLMSAQYDNLLAQRRAAGLSDSTLPNYHGASAANSQGWTLYVDASGNKAYVSPDGKSFQEVK